MVSRRGAQDRDGPTVETQFEMVDARGRIRRGPCHRNGPGRKHRAGAGIGDRKDRRDRVHGHGHGGRGGIVRPVERRDLNGVTAVGQGRQRVPGHVRVQRDRRTAVQAEFEVIQTGVRIGRAPIQGDRIHGDDRAGSRGIDCDRWRRRVAAGAGEYEVAVRAQWDRSAGKHRPEAVAERREVHDAWGLLTPAEESQGLVGTAFEQGERDRELVHSVVRSETRAGPEAPGTRESGVVREARVVRGVLYIPVTQGTVVHPMGLIRRIPSDPALDELVLVPVRRHGIVPGIEREGCGIARRHRHVPDGVIGHEEHRQIVFNEEIGGQRISRDRSQVDHGRVAPFTGGDHAVNRRGCCGEGRLNSGDGSGRIEGEMAIGLGRRRVNPEDRGRTGL